MQFLWLLKFGGFLKKHWKIIAIIVAVLAAIFLFNRWLSGVKKEAYDNGVVAERTIWQAEVARQNAANREYERNLAAEVLNLSNRVIERENIRTVKETTHTNIVKELIEKDPDAALCKVEPEVLVQRNAIRRLGPNLGE